MVRLRCFSFLRDSVVFWSRPVLLAWPKLVGVVAALRSRLSMLGNPCCPTCGRDLVDCLSKKTFRWSKCEGKRHPVLVAQDFELKFNQRPQRRRYLPYRKILDVHPLDAFSDLAQRRPNQYQRIVLGPLQLLRRVLAAPGSKVGITSQGALAPVVTRGPGLPISFRCFSAIFPMLGHSRHDTPINGRKIAIEAKCCECLRGLTRLPLPKIAVTHGGPARQCSPPSASRWRPRTSALAPSPSRPVPAARRL